MTIWENIIYGLISGFTEFLPVSSQGHQAILMRLFGQNNRDPVQDILVHIAMLLALLTACRSLFLHMQREHQLSQRSRRRNRAYDRKGIYDLRLIKTALVPMLAGMLLYIATKRFEHKLIHLALFFILNGIIIIVPEYMAHGNKDARVMTGWDGILIGLFGALSALPGVSRIGAMSSIATVRGADRQTAVNWFLVLSAPAIVIFIVFDIVNMFTLGFATMSFVSVLGYILSAVSAYCGSYFGIVILRYVAVQIGYSGFAYYSWGAAMFSFVLYLIV